VVSAARSHSAPAHPLIVLRRYEGNPCNAHLLGLGQKIKKSLHDAGLTGYQYGVVGVSDGISMGTDAMSYSLPSRDLIADSVESASGGHWLDGCVVVPGCDKNMPGVLMALGRLNRPGLMVYGGTIKPGGCGAAAGTLDIVSAFQSYGQYLSEGGTPEAERKRYDTVRNSCPGPGACGGMYSECGRGRALRSAQSHTPCSGQHDGVVLRGARHDAARQQLLPGRVPGEAGRVRVGGRGDAQPA
jgi:dihydroxyacid dehydratase/phosphogluconate dehydratase